MVSREDISGVKRIFGQALTKGVSVRDILGMLASAVNGHFTASRGYDEKDRHLATTIMRVGDTALLDMMHQAGNIPSVSYAQKKLQHCKVRSVVVE